MGAKKVQVRPTVTKDGVVRKGHTRKVKTGKTEVSLAADTEAVSSADPVITEVTWDSLGLGSSREWWSKAGFEPEDAARWRDAGFIRHTDARDWNKHFEDPEEAAQWFQPDAFPQRAAQWRDAGHTPQSSQQWRDAGVNEPEIASAWKSADFSPEQAEQWVGHQVPHPAEALKLLSEVESKGGARVYPQHTENHISAEVQASMWAKYGVEPEEAHRWDRAGFGYKDQYRPGITERWKKEGVEPEEAGRWKDAGMLSPHNVPYLKRYDVTPETYVRDDEYWARQGPGVFETKEQWKDIGCTPEEASAYHDAGMNLDESERYVKNGFVGATYYAELGTKFYREGIEPESAALWSGVSREATYGFREDVASKFIQRGWAYNEAVSLIGKLDRPERDKFVEDPPQR